MVLELAAPQATVVSSSAVIVGKAAGLIVILETSAKARPTTVCCPRFGYCSTTRIWRCGKVEVPYPIKQHLLIH
jgi:hypothetical protein